MKPPRRACKPRNTWGVQIIQVLVGLAGAADTEGVGHFVSAVGRDQFGLLQCGVSWQRASPPEAWWVREPETFAAMYRELGERHAPVSRPARAGELHKLLLPVIEPSGLLGAICCGHDGAPTADHLRDLTTLAAHVSVRLVQLGAQAANAGLLGRLTRRQVDVALLAARGCTNAGIARELGLSQNTIKKHLKDVFEELGVANRTELAVRLGHAPMQVQVVRLASGAR